MSIIDLLFYLNILIYIIVFGKWLYNFLNNLQQSHYKIKRMKEVMRKYYTKKCLLIYPLIILAFSNDLVIDILILTIGLFYLIRRKQIIVKLKYTKRLWRLLVTIIICYGCLDLLIYLFLGNSAILFFLLLNLLLIPIVTSLALLINKPIEKLVNNHYLNQAKQVLASNNHLLKIAITGSYGKTTIKNILYTALRKQYLTVMTEKSYNTLLGVAKTINERINNTTEIFIVEMGAMEPGDIKELMELVHPQIGIISEIGPQHLETFKTIQKIIKTKFELVERLTYNDVVILNYDNEYIRNQKITNVGKIVTISTKPKGGDYYLQNLTLAETMKFTIYHNDEEVIDIKTPLLGIHNTTNILLSIACLKALHEQFKIKLNWTVIQNELSQMSQIPHRLEYHRYDNIHYYDDSYNSNFQGMKNAIDLLAKNVNYKIIITPGLVELGKDSEQYNQELAKIMHKVFDEIYLIKNKASIAMINYFQEIKADNFFVYNSFKEAYLQIIHKHQNEEIALLVANDLPDCYLER